MNVNLPVPENANYPLVADEYRSIESRRVGEHNTDSCPRCGSAHAALPIFYLFRPIADESGAWRWWAICPLTSDPILISDLDEIAAEWVERVRNMAPQPG